MPAKDPGVHDEHIEDPIEDTPLPTCPACGVTRAGTLSPTRSARTTWRPTPARDVGPSSRAG